MSMRLPTPAGADHPRARFDRDQIEAIRERLTNEKADPLELARDLDCHPDTIRRIGRRETYR